MQELVIDGRPERSLLRQLRELWSYRGTLVAFTERNVRLKYKQMWLGVAWSVLQPLLFMAVFTLALGKAAQVPGGGAPYAAFALSALVGWTYLSNAVSFGANALVNDAKLLRKVYFPREASTLGGVLGTTVDLVAGLALFVVLGPFLGARLSIASLLVVVLIPLMVMLAAAIAMLIGAMNVYYRDFRYALPFALQLWLFGSPVAYPLSVVPDRWRDLYVAVNPAAGLLDGFRATLALGEPPDWSLVGLSTVTTGVILTVAYAVFKRMEPNFADVV